MASLSTNVGRPVNSDSRRRNGKSRHPGMLRGDTASPPARIGPPQPTPHIAAVPWSATSSTTSARVDHDDLGTAPDGVGAHTTSRRLPASSTWPAASLVPPMSTARHCGTTCRSIAPAAPSTVVHGAGSCSRRKRPRSHSRASWTTRPRSCRPNPLCARPWVSSGRANRPFPIRRRFRSNTTAEANIAATPTSLPSFSASTATSIPVLKALSAGSPMVAASFTYFSRCARVRSSSSWTSSTP